MNVHGSHHFDAPRDAVFGAIRDPRILMAVIPGCQAVEEIRPGEYEGRIALRLPGAAGTYRTHVRLVDVAPPERTGMQGRVEGSMGTIEGTASFSLAANGAGTRMDYEGSAVIDGPLARLDSRFAERLAESLIGQGLRALDQRLAMEEIA
jgi:2-furoyl-CoA dehydrogenase large subunit